MMGEPGKKSRPPDPFAAQPEDSLLRGRMAMVRRKVLVLSGKGGVGKSTVAANLAIGLAAAGRKVGLLDVDVHGPSIPQLLGLRGRSAEIAHGAILPVQLTEDLSVMSIAFLVQGLGDAVIWRGPMKAGVIRQFLTDVEWGPLDFLVVDSPPGTGDEPLSVAQNVGAQAAALIVTTPQDLAVSDVRRCVSFCRAISLPILGIVENMSGLACPHCGQRIDLFKTGGGEALAAEAAVPFLGRIPIDPAVVASGDEGCPLGGPFAALVARVLVAEPEKHG
jgi:ATP-binding protein involved in chromosome partitioning